MANKKNKSRKGTGHANKAWKDRARTAEVERDALSAEVATLRTELEMADAQVAAGRETLAHHASEVSTSATEISLRSATLPAPAAPSAGRSMACRTWRTWSCW